MSLEVAKYVLWLSAPVLQIGILFAMERKKLRQDFPFFFNYLIFQILSVLVLFSIYHVSYPLYFYAYWTSSALGIALGFAVIYEIFSYSLRPYAGLRDLGAMLFRFAAFLLILVSGLSAASASGAEGHRLTMAVMGVERSVRLMQCGLLLFVLVCSSYLGLSLKNFAYGIAMGFGVFAASDLTILNFRTQVGPQWTQVLSLISSGMYNVSVLAWMGYALLPQAKRLRTGFVYRPLFDRWNQAALLVVGSTQSPMAFGHTYLSEIEQTVDNVLANNAARTNLG